MELLVVWLSCSALSIIIMIDWWREKLDVEFDDMVFFIAIGVLAGPFQLFVSIMLWIGQRVGRLTGNITVWRKK